MANMKNDNTLINQNTHGEKQKKMPALPYQMKNVPPFMSSDDKLW